MTTFKRFLDKIDCTAENGCWLWTAGTDKNGYGIIAVNRRTTKAHRLSWLMAHGSLKDDDLVLHRCDVRSCVNPAHLFVGTHADNMADMKAKNRARGQKGAANHKAKLSLAQIAQIKKLLKFGRSCNSIAKEYGVVHSTISRIMRGEGWV